MRDRNDLVKIALVGGPSCGKTSIICDLEKRGYDVMHEIARKVLEERKEFPPTTEEIEMRQKIMHERQIFEEKTYTDNFFLDRGAVDVVGYSRHFLGYVPFCFKDPGYDVVFELERLPFENDGLRTESGDDEARIIHGEVMKAYSDYGYSAIKIPIFKAPTIREAISIRTDYLLSKLGNILDD